MWGCSEEERGVPCDNGVYIPDGGVGGGVGVGAGLSAYTSNNVAYWMAINHGENETVFCNGRG